MLNRIKKCGKLLFYGKILLHLFKHLFLMLHLGRNFISFTQKEYAEAGFGTVQNKQIVLTCDRPPKDIEFLEDRLRTRFEGGVMADVQPPDFETRMVIIRKKAAQLGLMLSDEAIEYIANNVTANIRQLEGVIKKLTAYKEILNEVITTDSVKRAIDDVIRSGPEIPAPDKIIKETARYYSIKDEEIRGQNRSKQPAEARQVAMYLMRSLTNLSLKDIGEQFENRNHTTVLSSIRKIEESLKTDPSMAMKIRGLRLYPMPRRRERMALCCSGEKLRGHFVTMIASARRAPERYSRRLPKGSMRSS